MLTKEFRITSDGSHTLFVPNLDETYHSTHGAIQEAKHVFIKAGLDQLKHSKINVLEIGFGTGLNALLTLLKIASTEQLITYTTIDAYPISIELVQQLNYPEELSLSHQNKELFHKLHQAAWETPQQINNQFVVEKIKVKLEDYTPKKKFDLIYFDAFGPRVQPKMWTNAIFKKMHASLKTNGILVTYCAKGSVKRGLKEVGFVVESLPGPPGKREMTRALKQG